MSKYKLFYLSVVFTIVLFAFGIFAKIMTFFDHNEHMYIVASVFVKEGKDLYKDFAYVQMPYLPLLYGYFFKLVNISSFYLLWGKLFSFLFFGISAVAIFGISWHISKQVFFSISLLLLFLLNETILRAAQEVSNYIIPIGFSLLGTYLFIISSRRTKLVPLGIFFAGLCIAFAAGTRLLYVVTVPPFLITALFFPRSMEFSKRLGIILFPFVGGIVVGLLPVINFLIRDPQLFILNNLEYHVINTDYRNLTEYSLNMSLFSKLTFGGQIFFKADNLILILSIFFILANLRTKSFNPSQAINSITLGLALAFLLFLFSTVAIFFPTPIFPEYFAMPIPFLFVFIICLYTWVIRAEQKFRYILVIFVLVSAFYSGSSMLKAIFDLTNLENWAGFITYNRANKIQYALRDLENKKIATLSPGFVIEANLPIYEEFSTGPFLYRVGDLLTADQRKIVKGTSPDTVKWLFDNEPPAAILVGFEEDKSLDGKTLETPLIEFAKRNNYRLLKGGYLGNGKLYIRDY